MNALATTHEAFEIAPSERDRVEYCSPAISVAVAAAVVCALLTIGGSGRLPALGWAAAYLFFAVESDLRQLRIPNGLNFGGLALALVTAASGSEALGLSTALAGVGAAFALLFPAFALSWLGAGDVKAAMVLGACFGTAALLSLLWWAFVISGVLGLVLVIARGELPDLLRRWGSTIRLLCLGVWSPAPARAGSAAASGLPFALALALGALSFDLWGVPWL